MKKLTWRSSKIIVASLAIVAALNPSVSFADSTVQTTLDETELSGFGLNGGNPNLLAQSFTATETGTVEVIDVWLASVNGSATDAARISIQGDNAGEPDGAELAFGTVDYTLLPSGPPGDLVSISLDVPVAITNGETYWVIFGRTGAYAGYPNGYENFGESPNDYGLGAQSTDDGATWSSWNATAYVTIYQLSAAGTTTPSDIPQLQINQAQSNLTAAFMVFFLSMFGTIWLLRRRN